MIAAMRVLVVDRNVATRDAVAEHLPGKGVVWATRETMTSALRGGIAAGEPFDVVLLASEPPPTPEIVRELVTQGGGVRVVLGGSGPDAAAVAEKCGASDVVTRPFVAAELTFRVGRDKATERADKRRPRKSDVLIGTGPWITE